jgi:hypothetical protein
MFYLQHKGISSNPFSDNKKALSDRPKAQKGGTRAHRSKTLRHSGSLPPMTRHLLTFGNRNQTPHSHAASGKASGYTKIKSADHFFTLSKLLLSAYHISQNCPVTILLQAGFLRVKKDASHLF